jgi:type IV pilus assembly protein PilY1
MNTFKRALAVLICVLLAQGASAASLSIAQYPLFLTSKTLPNVLVIFDNSESMDATMAGKVIAGNDPNTRGNISRRVITNTINSFSGQFNWGLETFQVYAWYPFTFVTYAYYMGDATTMVYTNDCVSGISVSTQGLRCIPNPQSGNGYNYITYAKTGDDPDINDVLYIWGDYGPQLYGIGVNNSTNYNIYLSHSAVATWNSGDFSGGQGTWGFTPTDAGFLPSTPPYPRQLFVRRAWDYLNYVTGAGVMVEPAKPSSDTAHFNNLIASLGQETSNWWSPDIKNSAIFTPLAGSMLTAKQYFSGTLPGYVSPITISCQKNFIMLATDGNPTSDWWGNMYPLSQQQNTYNSTTQAWTFSQAANDVFGQITPLRTLPVSGNKFDIQTYVVGMGDSVANPSSIAVLNQFAKLGGTTSAYLADDVASLTSAFQAIAVDIQSKTAAASAVSLNTGAWANGTDLYQARFNSGDWSGQLLAYPVNMDGTLGSQLWDAGQVINSQNWDSGRTILTYKPSAALGNRGIPFRWPATYPGAPGSNEMDLAQSALLNADMGGTVDGYGSQRVQWIRGNPANEIGTCGSCTPSFRSRPTSKLGDIIHSAPSYVAAPAFGYPDGFEGVAYSGFAVANSGRSPMVYVGSNDGMLHAFDAKTGTETLAYVPTAVYQNLSQLTTQGKSPVDGAPIAHHYYVDGSPTIGDVFYGGAWHTLLAGALGAGGQGVYVLDVTDPSNFKQSAASALVRWEFNDTDDADLGFVFEQPLMVKTNNGRWSVIIGNGYNNTTADGHASTTGHAVLYVLDAETGVLKAKLDTLSGTAASPNGLSGPIAVDTDNDGIADVVYAGDLAGNMWKFDLSAATPGAWNVALSGTPLFSTGGQPITVRPDVTKYTQGGYLVVFGTGQYIDANDNATTATQTFYGIRDTGAAVSGLASLVRQNVVRTASGVDGNLYRLSTHAVGAPTLDAALTGDNTISATDYTAGKKGWYLNLLTSGERVVTDATIRSGRVVFNTLIPNTDPCGFGGSGWVMEVDVMTGNRYDTPTFDTNGDQTISTADLVNAGGSPENTSGRFISSIPAAAGFLRAAVTPGKPPFENKYVNTSSGNVSIIGETAGLGQTGRASWRQIQ